MNRDAAIAALVDAVTKLLDAAAALDALDELVIAIDQRRDMIDSSDKSTAPGRKKKQN